MHFTENDDGDDHGLTNIIFIFLNRQVPPLPSFAIELMAQKSSGSLSPTIQELTRQESSSSSDKGWTSDPDNSPKKLKKQQPLKEAKEEWEQVETVTAGLSYLHSYMRLILLEYCRIPQHYACSHNLIWTFIHGTHLDIYQKF